MDGMGMGGFMWLWMIFGTVLLVLLIIWLIKQIRK
jgi:hypothetical protein